MEYDRGMNNAAPHFCNEPLHHHGMILGSRLTRRKLSKLAVPAPYNRQRAREAVEPCGIGGAANADVKSSFALFAAAA